MPDLANLSLQSSTSSPWVPTLDPATGNTYYYHRVTKETSWTKPMNDELPVDQQSDAKSGEVAVVATTAQHQQTVEEDDPALWKRILDPSTQREYYYHELSKRVTWTLPASLQHLVDAAAAAASASSASSSAAASDDWQEAIDPATGRSYWYHRVTGQSSWTAPEATRATNNSALMTSNPLMPTTGQQSSAVAGPSFSNYDEVDEAEEEEESKQQPEQAAPKPEVQRALPPARPALPMTLPKVTASSVASSSAAPASSPPALPSASSAPAPPPSKVAPAAMDSLLSLEDDGHGSDDEEEEEEGDEEDDASKTKARSIRAALDDNTASASASAVSSSISTTLALAKHRKGWFHRTFRVGSIFTPEKLLSYKKSVIKKALLKQNRAVDQVCVQLFKNVMSFMQDRSSSKSGDLHLLKILHLTLKSPGGIRDELYVQLMKQLTNNPNKKDSLYLGWTLLSICLTFFPPSHLLVSHMHAFIVKNLTAFAEKQTGAKNAQEIIETISAATALKIDASSAASSQASDMMSSSFGSNSAAPSHSHDFLHLMRLPFVNSLFSEIRAQTSSEASASSSSAFSAFSLKKNTTAAQLDPQGRRVFLLSQLCLFYLPLISALGPRQNVPGKAEIARLMRHEFLPVRVLLCNGQAVPSLAELDKKLKQKNLEKKSTPERREELQNPAVFVHPFMKVKELNRWLQQRCALTHERDSFAVFESSSSLPSVQDPSSSSSSSSTVAASPAHASPANVFLEPQFALRLNFERCCNEETLVLDLISNWEHPPLDAAASIDNDGQHVIYNSSSSSSSSSSAAAKKKGAKLKLEDIENELGSSAKLACNPHELNTLLFKCRAPVRRTAAALAASPSSSPSETDEEALYLSFLQAHRDVVSGRFPMSEKECTALAALYLQATQGNAPSSSGARLFEIRQLLLPPAWTPRTASDALWNSIAQKHQKLDGFSPSEAQLSYLDYASSSTSTSSTSAPSSGAAYFGSTCWLIEQRQFTEHPSVLWLALNADGILLLHPGSGFEHELFSAYSQASAAITSASIESASSFANQSSSLRMRILESFTYHDIVTWGHSDDKFIFVVGNLIQQRKLILKTKHGVSINHLCKEYVKLKVAQIRALEQ